MTNQVLVDVALLTLLVESIDKIKVIHREEPETQARWAKVINEGQEQARAVLLEHESIQQFTTGSQAEPVETHKTFI